MTSIRIIWELIRAQTVKKKSACNAGDLSSISNVFCSYSWIRHGGTGDTICFNKPFRWFWYILKFENHCTRTIFWYDEYHIQVTPLMHYSSPLRNTLRTTQPILCTVLQSCITILFERSFNPIFKINFHNDFLKQALRTYPLLFSGDVGEREGQVLLADGSSSSSSDELSMVRSITSTFLLLFEDWWWEATWCSNVELKHPGRE